MWVAGGDFARKLFCISASEFLEHSILVWEAETNSCECFGENLDLVFSGPGSAFLLSVGFADVRVAPLNELNWDFKRFLKQSAKLYGKIPVSIGNLEIYSAFPVSIVVALADVACNIRQATDEFYLVIFWSFPDCFWDFKFLVTGPWIKV